MNGQDNEFPENFGVDNRIPWEHFLLRVRRQIAEPMNDDPNGK